MTRMLYIRGEKCSYRLLIARSLLFSDCYKLVNVFYSDDLSALMDKAYRYSTSPYHSYVFTCYDKDGNVVFDTVDYKLISSFGGNDHGKT